MKRNNSVNNRENRQEKKNNRGSGAYETTKTTCIYHSSGLSSRRGRERERAIKSTGWNFLNLARDVNQPI